MRVTMLDTIVLHLAIRSLPCKLLPTVQAGLPPHALSPGLPVVVEVVLDGVGLGVLGEEVVEVVLVVLGPGIVKHTVRTANP